MKEERESKVIAEVRRIRWAHQKEARRIGRRKYIEKLNRMRGCFRGEGVKYPDAEPAEPTQVKEAPKRKYGQR